MTNRREFLKRSAVVSFSPFVPVFLPRSLSAADVKPDERALVVVQLDGGNDGLNTVIPFADELYAKHRRELRINPQDVLKLDEAVGFHPQMKPAATLFEEGRLAVVQGVGYPNPNRSHFESMAIWHHARLNADEHDGIGWLGRAADLMNRQTAGASESVYVGAEAVPVALRARRASAMSLESEGDLKLAAGVPAGSSLKKGTVPLGGADTSRQNQSSERDSPLFQQAARGSDTPASHGLSAFVQRTVDQSYEAARRFAESGVTQSGSGEGYPQSKLGQKLRLVSRLMKLGGGTRIYYVSQTGYDTHAAQSFTHAQLLREFSSALKAFLDDLRAAKLDERVMVVAFSEFGRRVEENASAGTDHGVAGPMFLAGNQIKTRLIGTHPRLSDLDAGDLKMAIDFRQVYAALLDQWLSVDSRAVLGERFAGLDL